MIQCNLDNGLMFTIKSARENITTNNSFRENIVNYAKKNYRPYVLLDLHKVHYSTAIIKDLISQNLSILGEYEYVNTNTHSRMIVIIAQIPGVTIRKKFNFNDSWSIVSCTTNCQLKTVISFKSFYEKCISDNKIPNYSRNLLIDIPASYAEKLTHLVEKFGLKVIFKHVYSNPVTSETYIVCILRLSYSQYHYQ